MGKTYVYLHHQGFDFFISDVKLSEEECYCEYCDEYDTLYGVFEDEASLKDATHKLFIEGYDVLALDNYEKMLLKYAPEEVFENYQQAIKYLESRDEV